MFEKLLLRAWIEKGAIIEPDGYYPCWYGLSLEGHLVRLLPTRVLVAPNGWPEISEETKRAMLEHAYPKIEKVELRRKSADYKLDRAIRLLNHRLS